MQAEVATYTYQFIYALIFATIVVVFFSAALLWRRHNLHGWQRPGTERPLY
jgi:hypothetical protein